MAIKGVNYRQLSNDLPDSTYQDTGYAHCADFTCEIHTCNLSLSFNLFDRFELVEEQYRPLLDFQACQQVGNHRLLSSMIVTF